MTEGGDRDKLGVVRYGMVKFQGVCIKTMSLLYVLMKSIMLTEYLSYLTASPVGREYFDIYSKKDNKFGKYKFDEQFCNSRFLCLRWRSSGKLLRC